MPRIEKIESNGKLYHIIRIYTKSEFTNEQKLIQIKNNFNIDTLIKNQTHYFLCNEISDAEFTEILPNETEQITEPVTEILTN
jgi:hypothetical protein